MRGDRPEIFSPPRGDPARAARAICAGCEVCAQCLAYSTVNAEEIYGIWGGISWVERLRIRDSFVPVKSADRYWLSSNCCRPGSAVTA